MSPIGMTLLLLVSLSAFAWTAARRWRQLRVGGAEPRLVLSVDEITARAKDTLVYAFGQRKMPYYRVAGRAHMAIFGGFMILTVNTLQLWVRGFDAGFDFWGVLAVQAPLGMAYSFAKELFILAVLFGCGVFVYKRVAQKGVDPTEGAHTQRMTLGNEGLIILGIIIVMMLGDLLYYGANSVLDARAAGEAVAFHPAEFASGILAVGLAETDRGTVSLLAHIGFWTHSGLVLIFLNILPFSKHFHIITAIPNVFLRDRRSNALPKVDDLEGKVEREEPVGINRLEDLSWNHMLDLYTCTECGRCSDNCPAYTTDKKLSPKHLTLALRDHLYDTEAARFAAAEGLDGTLRGGGEAPSEDAREEIHTYPRPPADAYFRSEQPVELLPHIVDPDVVWACTSCRACEEQCPVMISYIDKIVGMRREQVMVKGEMPPELMRPFQGMEMNGNPWNLSSSDRAEWSSGLEVRTLADHRDAEVLYWVGCAASYDDRAKKTARTLVKLLNHAGVDFAILGTEESCTGDAARRAGNEYLFQMMAESNIETLNGYGVDQKVILTACPHCFNTLKNEYPDFGGHYEVVHHTDYLMGLVAAGKLVPKRRVRAKVAFHDSCYLGRYNDVYQSPREILEAIPGVELREVPYWNHNKGLCCGAGGAQYFMEEQNENRVSTKRTLQLLDTGCETIASGCPFCMTMLTDGLKAEEKEEDVEQLDVAELLERSVDFDVAAADDGEAEAAE